MSAVSGKTSAARWLRTDGNVGLRLLAGLFLEVSLGLEDVHHGLDRGVGDRATGLQFLIDLAHGGLLAKPDDFHDLEFLAGEGLGLGTHTN